MYIPTGKELIKLLTDMRGCENANEIVPFLTPILHALEDRFSASFLNPKMNFAMLLDPRWKYCLAYHSMLEWQRIASSLIDFAVGIRKT